MLKLSAQEQLLPGDTLQQKWEFAQRAGYHAIELRGRADFALRGRLPELRQALRDGVVMPTVCVEMLHFFGAFDADLRADAIAQMKSQLSVIGELGGLGAMSPASYGMFSRRLPPFEPPRSEAEDRQVLLDGLRQLGEHAAAEGVTFYLEPLNRYEDHMVNRLDQAIDLIREVGLDSVRVGADTYHMNIEEDDPIAALHAAAPYIGHVQVSESNRFQPGTGHIDWPAVLGVLEADGYPHYLALESRLRGEPAEAVASVPAFLRRMSTTGQAGA
ncbi:sugar phosphate isomerase/epimerase family protein [Catellatospora vulcania]|uniref:sugar phosphate isomerase/epimerase family protein n=1 Tax=Catellatospora vulcania TaxID=1460450 RepID=UPI0012D38361|nr:sugar phosphate isomerase/epimerase family protein [Catellatospora vulcania]